MQAYRESGTTKLKNEYKIYTKKGIFISNIVHDVGDQNIYIYIYINAHTQYI